MEKLSNTEAWFQKSVAYKKNRVFHMKTRVSLKYFLNDCL